MPDAWDFGPGNIGDYQPATSVSDLFNAGAGFLSSAANAYYGFQRQQLTLDQQQAAIDIAKIQSGAQVDIAKMQAQSAVDRARWGAGYSFQNLDQTLANLGTRMGQSNGGQLMLWLAVAGVGIAVLQYMKKG